MDIFGVKKANEQAKDSEEYFLKVLETCKPEVKKVLKQWYYKVKLAQFGVESK